MALILFPRCSLWVAATDFLVLNPPVSRSFPESCTTHLYYLQPLSAKTHGWQNAATHLPSSQIWSHVADSWLKRCWLTDSRCDLRPQHPSTTEARRGDVSSVIQDFYRSSLKALRAQSSLSLGYTQENIACSEYNGGFITWFSPRRPAVVYVSHEVSAVRWSPCAASMQSHIWGTALPSMSRPYFIVSSASRIFFIWLHECWLEREGGKSWSKDRKSGWKELQWDRIQTPQEQ